MGSRDPTDSYFVNRNFLNEQEGVLCESGA